MMANDNPPRSLVINFQRCSVVVCPVHATLKNFSRRAVWTSPMHQHVAPVMRVPHYMIFQQAPFLQHQ